MIQKREEGVPPLSLRASTIILCSPYLPIHSWLSRSHFLTNQPRAKGEPTDESASGGVFVLCRDCETVGCSCVFQVVCFRCIVYAFCITWNFRVVSRWFVEYCRCTLSACTVCTCMHGAVVGRVALCFWHQLLYCYRALKYFFKVIYSDAARSVSEPETFIFVVVANI